MLAIYLNKCVCFDKGPQGKATWNQCEIFNSKFLACTVAGVRPEPKGCPGKATSYWYYIMQNINITMKKTNFGKCKKLK